MLTIASEAGITTNTLEEAWPRPPPDHVAQPNAKPPLVPVTAVRSASV